MLKIVRVDFPLLDKPGKVKNRPVVCITYPIGRYKQVIVAPITSKTTDSVATDVIIDQTHAGFGTTGLSKTSRIQLHKLVSIGEKRLQGQLGVLPQPYDAEMKAKLRQLFTL
jgi:mRNA-degrading endonuclease toxin of MazEF toxin-antitoxin module